MKTITTDAIKALVKSYDDEFGVTTYLAVFAAGDASIIGTYDVIKHYKSIEEVYVDIKERLFPTLTEGERLELIAHETGNYFAHRMIQRKANA
jgi:hypothetical protein